MTDIREHGGGPEGEHGRKQAGGRGFGVYVHWPFCLSKCPYCDFNSHVAGRVDHAAWRRAFAAEIGHAAGLVPGRTVTSVFFGGGTPSLMAPETAATVLEEIRRHWTMSADVEITLEANPTSVEAGRFAAFADAGVNRVSLGVQALNDRDLAFLGRGHDVAQALDAVGTAHRHFDRVSFDLIYARPDQTVADWTAELRRALDHAVGHLSVYQLTIEPGTPFAARHAKGELVIPDEDLGAALFEATREVLAAAGLPAYEISNHARPGEESRHNLVYWRYGDYVGIGPGAHGRLTLTNGKKVATRAHAAPRKWLAAVDATGHGWAETTELSRRDRALEALLMGLRLTAGLSLDTWAEEAGRPFGDSVDRDLVGDLVDAGYVTLDDETLVATPEGQARLNAVINAIAQATDVDRSPDPGRGIDAAVAVV